MRILQPHEYPRDYNPVEEFTDFIDIGGPKMQGRRGRYMPIPLPTLTLECDSFEEFCKWNNFAVQSLQHGLGPWIATIPFTGYCGDCGDPIGYKRGYPVEDYLCKDCRTTLDKQP